MKQKYSLFFFIKIATSILSIWICHFSNDIGKINKYLNENYTLYDKLHTRCYRLLAQCKPVQYSHIMGLKVNTSNGMNKTNDIYNKEKGLNGRNKQSSWCSSNSPACHKKDINNNSYIFEKKKCSYFEKNIFKELDFMDFLKNNKTVSDKTYKIVIRKKYGLRIATPVLLFLLFLILLTIDFSLGISIQKSLPISIASWDPLGISTSGWFKKIFNEMKNQNWFWKSPLWTSDNAVAQGINETALLGRFCGVLIYFLPFFILGVTVISAIIYYHKKVKKYEKIKFRKR
ncbi:fam-l protein [Plasmodium malariae]|uniref:Fam-l protein n=1 Tax=Plasmodium malariae TaxID=5858 RepID=A0A1D3RH85_PLAMA|nr:fam-l protein [Plasmodium malariae]SCN44546.1 fam-l protein [Plasmodium malariae]